MTGRRLARGRDVLPIARAKMRGRYRRYFHMRRRRAAHGHVVEGSLRHGMMRGSRRQGRHAMT